MKTTSSCIQKPQSSLKVTLITACILLTMLAGCTFPLFPSGTATTNPVIEETAATPTPDIVVPTATPIPPPVINLDTAFGALFEGDYSTATTHYQTALDNAPDQETQAAALLGLGRAAIGSGDCSLALRYLQQVTTQFGNSSSAAAAYFFSAQCEETLEQYSQAASDYGAYLNLHPGLLDADILTRQGNAYSQAGDHAASLQAWQSALLASPPGDYDSLNLLIGRYYSAIGDYENAVRIYLDLYNVTASGETRATANYLMGEAYLAMGYPEQAYARFQDSVTNYYRYADAYSGLVILVNDGVPVIELYRGLVDYYSGLYGLASDAFQRYLDATPEHDATAHLFMGYSYMYLDQADNAIAAYDAIITDHPGDPLWATAWDEKAWMQWTSLEQYAQGAQTLLDYVARIPDASEAPGFLLEAGRIYETGNLLNDAASTWERIINEYPNSEPAYQSLFLAGITRYRLGQYSEAQVLFQRCLVLAPSTEDQTAAYLWIGKSQLANGDSAGAALSWQAAEALDPTGYYSIRAGQLARGESPFNSSVAFDLGYDLNAERVVAEAWLRQTFQIAPEVDLSGPGELAGDIRVQRVYAYWELGLYQSASNLLNEVRQSVSMDAIASYRILNLALDLGLYRTAIFASRQILNLANLNDETSLNAPAFFNHIRFGVYYRNLIAPAASEEGFNALVIFSLVRQESMFEGFVSSSMGARGLMQIMPATGAEIASMMGWPANYTNSDLYRPYISVPMGVRYLARMRDYFGGDLYAGIAAYNGGAGNVTTWLADANNDPDLFVEITRLRNRSGEVYTYLTQIVEFYSIYRSIYERRY